MAHDINVLALVKGQERYIFLYDDADRAELLRILGRFATNPELSFTWYDAATLSGMVRRQAVDVFRLPTLRHRFNTDTSSASGL